MTTDSVFSIKSMYLHWIRHKKFSPDYISKNCLKSLGTPCKRYPLLQLTSHSTRLQLFFLLLVCYLYNTPVYQPGTILLFTTCATSLRTDRVLCSWSQPVRRSCVPLGYRTSVRNSATYLTFNDLSTSFISLVISAISVIDSRSR